MAEAIVDQFEVIQIHGEYAITLAMTALAGNGNFHLVIHGPAVTCPRQWVTGGKHLELVALATGAVGKDEGHDSGGDVGDQKRDHLIVTFEHAAWHP